MFPRKDKVEKREVASAEGSNGTPKYLTRGVYGLKKCHDPGDAVADIVFVHGLTGNRESTWTDKSSGVFWPAHLLKNVVPNTRIVTFGYDADVAHFWAMASQNRIGNHALNLVNALSQMRERTETEDRPILFVTHSLGGLVFEDAMLSSKNSAEPHIRSLFDCTVGVCFLGTPHCGSSAANWATVFGSIANVVKTTNTSLLNVLQPESEVLARIQRDFHTMLRASLDEGRPALKITCFYEELPVRGVGEIVPKHSAILPAYNSIGIHANHMDMTKFSDDEDQGYLSVSTEILRWVRVIQKASQLAPPAAPVQYRGMLPAPSPNIASPSDTGYLRQQQQQRPRAPSPYQKPPYGGYLTQQQSAPMLPMYGGQSPPPREQRPQPQTYSSAPQMHQEANVISGNVNNYGSGKVIQGNNFQITSEGPVTF